MIGQFHVLISIVYREFIQAGLGSGGVNVPD